MAPAATPSLNTTDEARAALEELLPGVDSVLGAFQGVRDVAKRFRPQAQWEWTSFRRAAEDLLRDRLDGETEKAVSWALEGLSEERDLPAPLFRLKDSRFGRFLEKDPPERRWTIVDCLPHPIVAGLGAKGGAGKSTLTYQLAFSVTTGLDFLGLPMGDPGGFLYLASEDDEDELHRRGQVLFSHYAREAQLAGRPLDQKAIADRLHVVSRVGADNRLTRTGQDGAAHATEFVDRIIASARQIADLRVIVLDPVSRFRGGRPNDEMDNTIFIEAAETIRDETGATVLVTSHVSRAGIREGGGQEILRGSTALPDGLRWVATMEPLKRERAKDYGLHEDEAGRYLKLLVVKNNYAPEFPGLWLRREAGGVLVPVDLERNPMTESQSKAEREYLDIVASLQGLIQSEGPKSRNQIRDYTGLHGVLGAGDKTVRSVIERAIRDGSLVDANGLLEMPE